MTIPDTPWIVKGAISFLEAYLCKNHKVLEFGAGGSTIWIQSRVEKIWSIEHNKDWYDKVMDYKQPNCELILADARDNSPSDLTIPCYSNLIEQFDDELFDFILVDGRNRVNCFLKCDRVLRPGGVIMLDNSEREEYSEVFSFYKEKQYFEESESKDWKTSWWIK
jgi:predicted O-methyltransferase YrrM